MHHPNINAHHVEIAATGFDFGNDDWWVNGPSSSGVVWWRLEPDGALTPHLTGTLWLNNVDGACARMNIRYLSEAGLFLTARPGGTVCVHDSGRHPFTVDLQPYTSNKIGQVNVQLQTQNANGTWNVVGSDTETVDCSC